MMTGGHSSTTSIRGTVPSSPSTGQPGRPDGVGQGPTPSAVGGSSARVEPLGSSQLTSRSLQEGSAGTVWLLLAAWLPIILVALFSRGLALVLVLVATMGFSKMVGRSQGKERGVGLADDVAGTSSGLLQDGGDRHTPLPTPIDPSRRDFSLHGARVDMSEFRVVDNEYATHMVTVSCKGQSWVVWRRYSDFEELREALVHGSTSKPRPPPPPFGNSAEGRSSFSIWVPSPVPSLPPKTLFRTLTPKFLSHRTEQLGVFMKELLKRRDLCDEPALRSFLDASPLAPLYIANDATISADGNADDAHVSAPPGVIASAAVPSSGGGDFQPPALAGGGGGGNVLLSATTSSNDLRRQPSPSSEEEQIPQRDGGDVLPPSSPEGRSSPPAISASPLPPAGGDTTNMVLPVTVKACWPPEATVERGDSPPPPLSSLRPAATTALPTNSITSASATADKEGRQGGDAHTQTANGSAGADCDCKTASHDNSHNQGVATSVADKGEGAKEATSRGEGEGGSPPPTSGSIDSSITGGFLGAFTRFFSISPPPVPAAVVEGEEEAKRKKEEDAAAPPIQQDGDPPFDKVAATSDHLPPVPNGSSESSYSAAPAKEEEPRRTLADITATHLSWQSPGVYYDPGPTNAFRVRGKTYMHDNKKVDAGPAAGMLVFGGVFKADGKGSRDDHIASRGRVAEVVAELTSTPCSCIEGPPYLFIINFQVPGDPPLSVVFIFAIPPSAFPPSLQQAEGKGRPEEEDPFHMCFRRFIDFSGESSTSSSCSDHPTISTDSTATASTAATSTYHSGASYASARSAASSVASDEGEDDDDEEEGGANDKKMLQGQRRRQHEGIFSLKDFKNKRFKLIPSIVEGPSVVRWAVGAKPAILGQKLTQRYFRGPSYVETDVDIASSVIASQIVSLCRGYARFLTVELGIVLQGECEAELPEKLIGCIGIKNLDLMNAWIDNNSMATKSI